MTRFAALASAGLLLVAACGDDDEAAETGSTTTTTVDDTATTDAGDTTTSAPATSDLLVLWPAAGDGVATPEEAAAGFMGEFFPDSSVTFDDFADGDGESGEIEVLGGGEGGGAELLRSTLLVRDTGDGWHVIAAVNPNVAITSPEAQAEVPAGGLVVEGLGRGFEATIGVRAELLGAGQIAQAVGAGGSAETPEPFSVDLDLGGAGDLSGETLVLIAQGDTGLEDDPGEFSAIPVVVEA